jgi:hypothetical protein
MGRAEEISDLCVKGLSKEEKAIKYGGKICIYSDYVVPVHVFLSQHCGGESCSSVSCYWDLTRDGLLYFRYLPPVPELGVCCVNVQLNSIDCVLTICGSCI